MEEPLSADSKHHIPDVEKPEFVDKPIEDKLSGLNIESKQQIDFSDAVAESERNSDSIKTCPHEAKNDIEDNDTSIEQNNKERRRGSLERYKPPTTTTYSREEREKHRRRGHFGETKKQDDVEQENNDTNRSGGRHHGRFRGKGKGKDEKSSPKTEVNYSNEEIDKNGEPQKHGGSRAYKSQLSKDWADYSFEDDNKQVEEEVDAHVVSQQGLQTQSKTSNKDSHVSGGPSNKENATFGGQSDQNRNRSFDRKNDRHNSRHDKNSNPRNDHRNQPENTDLRQKLNDKRAANAAFDKNSNNHNQRQQNGNFNGHGDNAQHQQRSNRGVVQSNWGKNVERSNNDRSHGYRGRETEDHSNNIKTNNHVQTAAGNLPRPKKNTENFNPSHKPPEMRILFATPGVKSYDRPFGSRDVVVVRDLFVAPGVDINTDLSIYNKLLAEIQSSGVDETALWKSWHGDSHLIADDKKNWKKQCPTFSWIVEKLAEYFRMDVQATRLNWYRDSTEWKPFHHDAAAMKPDKAKTQNMTVGVSFGAERDAAFEHAKNRCVVSMPQPNGTVYTFGRDVNILWRHGIPQLAPSIQNKDGRISIICWGWAETFDM